MPRINPAILVWARDTAGMSPEDAAKRLGLNDTKKAKAVERLAALEAGAAEPPRSLLAKMAKTYRRPLLTFYLAEPPRKGSRGKDFRTLPTTYSPSEDALVDALIRDVQARQGIVLEALILEDEAVEREYVGALAMRSGVAAGVDFLQRVLGFTRDQYRAAATADEAFKRLRARAEAVGVYVILQGDLGSHHSAIGADAFRGFALADKYAPFIVINDHDSVSAWSFTLLHELVHLFLGETGVSGSASETATERFCNEVASEFLVAGAELRALNVNDRMPIADAQNEITAFARARRVSGTMVAYRLLRSGALSHAYWQPLHQAFRDLWLQSRAQQRERGRDKVGGPDYYTVRRHRIGDALIHFVRRMVGTGALTTTKAAKVLAVQPQSVTTLVGRADRAA